MALSSRSPRCLSFSTWTFPLHRRSAFQSKNRLIIRSADQPLESLERSLRREEHANTQPPRQKPITQSVVASPVETSRDFGTFWLCFANIVGFVLDHVMRLTWMGHLYLYHAAPRWWQLFTSAFCHADWAHLSSNIFMLYVFGKLVEQQEGAFGVWATYLICALGGNLAALWLYPPSAVSLGASAAVFGLFAVSVLVRISWKFKKLVEVGILGQFVIAQVINEVNMQMQGGSVTGSGQVSHIAHLGGALMGVILILLLQQLPDQGEKKN